jgi:hypothetical protein
MNTVRELAPVTVPSYSQTIVTVTISSELPSCDEWPTTDTETFPL